MAKDFDAWNTRKKGIESNDTQKYVHEREIWWASLGLNIGDEEDGKNELFERPVLVIRKFNQRIVLTVPLTTRTKENKYYFPFIHNGTPSSAILSQLRLVSTKRFTRRIRKIDEELHHRIVARIVELVF